MSAIGRRLGQELLVDAQEQVLPREALVHQVELGAHHRGIRVLDEHRRDGRPAVERLGIAGQDRPEPRLVERADRPVHAIQALDEAPVERVDGRLAVDRAPARVLPRARHRGEARHRVHLRGAVSRPAEPVVAADEAPLGPPVEPGELHDLLDGQPRDLGGPRGRPRPEMRGQLVRGVGVAPHVGPVRVALGEEDVHDRARERAVGAGPEGQVHVGALRRARPVRVDHDQRRARAAARG